MQLFQPLYLCYEGSLNQETSRRQGQCFSVFNLYLDFYNNFFLINRYFKTNFTLEISRWGMFWYLQSGQRVKVSKFVKINKKKNSEPKLQMILFIIGM